MEYVIHSGIKGMKWGVRRYQNPDGTLTDAGKKRYGYGLKKGSSEYERKHSRAYNELRSEVDKLEPEFKKADRKLLRDVLKKNPTGLEFENPADPKIVDRYKKAYDAISKRDKTMRKTLKQLGMDETEVAYREAGYNYTKYLQGNVGGMAVSYALGGPIGAAAYTAYRSNTHKAKVLGAVYAKAAERYKG